GDSVIQVAELSNSVRSYIATIEPNQRSTEYLMIASGIGAQHEETSSQLRIVPSATTFVLTTLTGGFASFQAGDQPNDGGGKAEISWVMADTTQKYKKFNVYRITHGESEWMLVGTAEPLDVRYVDQGLEDGKSYSYRMRAYGNDAIYESKPVVNVITEAAWFDMRKINLLIIALIILTAVISCVMLSHKKMFIRKIAGLSAVEEAVGRATEMGRSVLFIPGISDLDDVQTLAGLSILGSVAKLTAEYETKLDVPVCRSLVMSNGREVVKEAYLSVGRPDFYHEDIVHYITDEQFGYVAGVDGIMVREEPAACFYMGAFFAESLILAETGNHIGAIQIAGTAMPSQLPFFVAACDYTLIGEELFAASAYLSKDQRMIASLRGQDIGKAMAMVSMLVGAGVATLATFTSNDGIWAKLSDAFIRLFALNF
ncbi:MAG: fibronectin type III domain-containing protein, partial [Candidatus Electryoneaceae bacterium]|nr:fibronectin type III domain-containing protein [Candidatus Electryoneaceae bacterium]